MKDVVVLFRFNAFFTAVMAVGTFQWRAARNAKIWSLRNRRITHLAWFNTAKIA
jgi:hypothetical protein